MLKHKFDEFVGYEARKQAGILLESLKYRKENPYKETMRVSFIDFHANVNVGLVVTATLVKHPPGSGQKQCRWKLDELSGPSRSLVLKWRGLHQGNPLDSDPYGGGKSNPVNKEGMPVIKPFHDPFIDGPLAGKTEEQRWSQGPGFTTDLD